MTGPWLRAVLAVNAVLVACTFYGGAKWPRHAVARPFHLGIETNAATWWSAALLLVFALLARSTARAVRAQDRAASRAWTILSLIGLALYADEIGSLHERARHFVPLAASFALLPFAAVIGAGLGYSLVVLERRRAAQGPVARRILVAFLVFGAVYAQEMIEYSLDLSGWAVGLRMAVEEATELAGMTILLWAALGARRRLLPPDRSPQLPDRSTLRWAVGLGALLAAPVLLVRSRFTAEELDIPRVGDFGLVIPVLAFICAGFGALLAARQDAPRAGRLKLLAGILLLLSLSAEVHFHRYLLGFVSWRYDLDLLAGLPLLAAVGLSVPALRRRRVILGLAVLGGLAVHSVFFARDQVLPIANLHLTSLAAAAAVVWWGAGTGAACLRGPGGAAGRNSLL